LTGDPRGGDKGGGREGGPENLHPPSLSRPTRACWELEMEGTQVIIKPPLDLRELCEWAFSDALDIDYDMVSDEVCIVWMLRAGYSYEKWLASLSLDHRWTLSPLY
jgi:hypothetical protein